MSNPSRRDVLKGGGAGAGALLLGGAVTGCPKPAEPKPDKIVWRLASTWPKDLPILTDGSRMLADLVREMSDGRLEIEVHHAGERVAALGTFEAAQLGNDIQISHGASYYWAKSVKGAPFFSAVPFGMNAQQMNAWIYEGGGLELWEALYSDLDLIPMPAGNTGVQMGGWFNQEIISPDSLRGLRMRIPGLGGEVMKRAGVQVVLTPGSKIHENLQDGTIDAAEWIGPYHDFLLELHDVAEYYYTPGWHEPGLVLEFAINKTAFEALPRDIQAMVRTAAQAVNAWTLAAFESKNYFYLDILSEKVEMRQFPLPVLEVLAQHAKTVIEDALEDSMSREIYVSFSEFKKKISSWSEVSEKNYHGIINKLSII